MSQFFKFFLLMIFSSFISCNENSKDEVKNAKTVMGKCDLKSAQNEILKLPEVIIKNKMIDSLSNHKHGVSLLSDTTIDGIKYYEIKAGYNSDLRYETYYNFYVEKGNCKNIKIFEPIGGDLISLEKWRTLNIKVKPLTLANWPYKSFVISCGSGCAMTYSAIKIKRNQSIIKVKFNVDQYIDEQLTDSFQDDFTFTYNVTNHLKNIIREGESEDFLETQSAGSQESFKKFAVDLIKFAEKDMIYTDAISKRTKTLSLPVNGNTIDILGYPTSEKFNFVNIEGLAPSSVIEINENLLLTWFESDTERWYLVIVINKKVIDHLLVGKSETVETEKGTLDNYLDFKIGKNLIVDLTFSSGKSVNSRKIQKTEKYGIRSSHFLKL